MADVPPRTPLPAGAVSSILAIMDEYARAHAAAVSAAKDAEIAQLRQYLDAAQRRAAALGDEVAGLREDAERGRYMINHGSWYRSDEQTRLAVLVPHGSDLSCYAMREAAIDAARKGSHADQA